jgi:hypothetical protein
MSSAKHEVTVYDRVPSTAAVSVAQIEAYLRRTGWSLRRKLVDDWAEWWSCNDERYLDVPPREEFRNWVRHAKDCIERLAEHERRQPSAVLADIAREPEQ